ncbi:MAG TPA: hypothetical protein VF708_08870 [Pyrinomonadaceae bacterium]|jgi:Tfp pilus assembly protein PilF
MRDAGQHPIRAARNIILVMMCACALSTHLISSAQTQQPKDARQYAQLAVKAYKEKDYAAFLENMRRAMDLRPTHQTYMYNLAVAYAQAEKLREPLVLKLKL